MFGNAECRLFLFTAQCFKTESMQKKLSCDTVVCKHFASYQGYPNYKWDLTLSLLMSCIYIYMVLLVKPEILTSSIWTYFWQR
jgi:hypothetical protein